MADNDDLKPLLHKLIGIVEGTARDMSGLRADMNGLRADVETLKFDMTMVKSELKVMNTRLDGFEKRLDDQGRILAALVPTRIAAVPPAAE